MSKFLAIITGASSGFGEALARRFVDHSTNAYAVLVDIHDGEGLASELNKTKGYPCCEFIKANVTSIPEMTQVFERAARLNQGKIDIVINNAGIGEKVPFVQDVEESWVQVVNVDLVGVMLGSRLALQYMQNNPNITDGVIINTASLAGLYPQPFQPAYAAAKGGVVHFTRSLAKYCESSRIRVNCVCPSFSPTGILQDVSKTVGLDTITSQFGPLVSIDLVVDAFFKIIKDSSMNGECVRVTPQFGIDVYQWRKSKPSKL